MESPREPLAALRLPALPVVAANVVTLALLALILFLKWQYGRDAASPGR